MLAGNNNNNIVETKQTTAVASSLPCLPSSRPLQLPLFLITQLCSQHLPLPTFICFTLAWLIIFNWQTAN